MRCILHYILWGVRMNLNLKIVQLRKQFNLTQTELAERCQTTQQTIAKIEQGSVDPRLTTLQRISEALGCELTELFYTQASFAEAINVLAKKHKLNLDKMSASELNSFCWETERIPQFHPFWKRYSIKNNKFVIEK